MKVHIDEEQWLWVEGNKSVAIVSSKAGANDTLILMEGEEAPELWGRLKSGIDLGPDDCHTDLISKLLEWGVIQEDRTVGGDTNNNSITGMLAKVTVRRVSLKELLPEELRLLSATQGKNGQNKTNVCNAQLCAFGATGCAYDVKLHYHILEGR